MKKSEAEPIVKLINYTHEPERTVAAAGRLCYSPVGVTELLEEMTQEQVHVLIRKLVEMEHLSALEHASFTFAIEGVSRVLTHQLVRHRIASYSQQSQRYVLEKEFEYVVPPSIAKNALAKERYTALMGQIRELYNEMVDMGVHQEDARYILPNATETKIVATMNTRSLLNFFSLRCCDRAQWEIRQVANRMLAEVKKVAPVLFEKAGADCITKGVCSEGALTCGRLARIQQKGIN